MKHEFQGDEITITYDDAVCTHAANCVRSLPAPTHPINGATITC